MLTHFQPVFHFYTPLKTENLRFSVFRGYKRGTLVEIGLISQEKSLQPFRPFRIFLLELTCQLCKTKSDYAAYIRRPILNNLLIEAA